MSKEKEVVKLAVDGDDDEKNFRQRKERKELNRRENFKNATASRITNYRQAITTDLNITCQIIAEYVGFVVVRVEFTIFLKFNKYYFQTTNVINSNCTYDLNEICVEIFAGEAGNEKFGFCHSFS